jgi:beta-lactamase regulating signal transducer with metallopeptidase domain
MTVAWILYALLVGTLLAAAARLLEGTLRIAAHPVRWVWAGALGLTIALAAIAPTRTTRDGSSSAILERAKVVDGAVSAAASRSWGENFIATLRSASLTVTAPVQRVIVAAERRVPPSAGKSLGMASLSLSALLVLVLSVVYARFHRLRRRWPVAELLGVRVRVSSQMGPAVVGLSRPEIVIPSWLLERTTDEQRLVLVHEREHVRAHDPLLLASACALAALLPWHPAVWYMLSRLRLAVELDCDVRVLRRGVAAHSYGTLLIDLAERCSGLRIGAPALADTSSHLEQRLLAMNTSSSRFAHLRACALGACAVLALLAACEAQLPTSADVEKMDVASAEKRARDVMFVAGDSGVTYFADGVYFIDGVKVTRAQAAALGPERTGSIEVTKHELVNGKPNVEIHITTRKPGDPVPDGLPRKETRIGLIGGDGSEKLVGLKRDMLSHERTFDGVLIIDGVRVNPSALSKLTPDAIASIEIIKAKMAASLYPAPEAAKGVIKITTKKGAAKQ